MSYKEALQANNIDLSTILTSINELPSTDGSGGVELPTLANEGSASDMLIGKQLIGSQGQVVTGTMEIADVAEPSIFVSSDGLITASTSQEEGFTIGGSRSVTQQLTVQEAKVVNPTKSEQVAVNSNVYTTGNIVVAAISDDYVLASDIEAQLAAI